MPSVWAISDPHLSFGVPNKSMEDFGPLWLNYENKIEMHWRSLITDEDLVLIPGDISWALHLEDALPDLKWIDALPGTKLMVKGNHDLWWPSSSKLAKVLPSSIHFIHNNHFDWHDITFGGSRLWDTTEYNFKEIIQFQENPRAQKNEAPYNPENEEKIFKRELERLKLSLQTLNPQAKYRIALTHYPPIGLDLKPSAASTLLEEFKIDACVFGHLHNVKKDFNNLFGNARGVQYYLTSCDYLDFIPIQII